VIRLVLDSSLVRSLRPTNRTASIFSPSLEDGSCRKECVTFDELVETKRTWNKSLDGWMDGWWCRYILIAGSIKVRKRMMKGDYGAAMDIAKKQVEDGAHVIDINVVDDGMLDGLSAMQKFVKIAVVSIYPLNQPPVC
jgi:hypothetical protein